MPLVLFLCSIISASSLHHDIYCIGGPASNTAVAMFNQSLMVTWLQELQLFNNCLTKGEYIPYDPMASFTLHKSNIHIGAQLASVSSASSLSCLIFLIVTGYSNVACFCLILEGLVETGFT